MNRATNLIISLTVLAMSLVVLTSDPGANASVPVKAPVARKHTQPTRKVWLRDVSRALAPVPSYLAATGRANKGRKLAIVLGVDDVALSLHYDWPQPVKQTLRVARRAHRLHMAVFFITGRTTKELPTIRKYLKKAGYTINGLCGRGGGLKVAPAKQKCRNRIAAGGHTITANIAASHDSFVGDGYDRAFMMPNYGWYR